MRRSLCSWSTVKVASGRQLAISLALAQMNSGTSSASSNDTFTHCKYTHNRWFSGILQKRTTGGSLGRLLGFFLRQSRPHKRIKYALLLTLLRRLLSSAYSQG